MDVASMVSGKIHCLVKLRRLWSSAPALNNLSIIGLFAPTRVACPVQRRSCERAAKASPVREHGAEPPAVNTALMYFHSECDGLTKS